MADVTVLIALNYFYLIISALFCIANAMIVHLAWSRKLTQKIVFVRFIIAIVVLHVYVAAGTVINCAVRLAELYGVLTISQLACTLINLLPESGMICIQVYYYRVHRVAEN